MEIRSRVAVLLTGVIILFFAGCSTTKEGFKNERETGISEEEFPQPSLRLVDELWPGVRAAASYYKQYEGDQEFYEIKFSAENGIWSLAFFPNGDPYDAEKLLQSSSDIPVPALKNITSYLNERFPRRWSMVKIQKRFVLVDPDDEPSELLEEIVYPDDDEDEDGYYDDDIAIQFEIVVEGFGENTLGTFELLFDNGGSLISSSKVIDPAEDAMWY